MPAGSRQVRCVSDVLARRTWKNDQTYEPVRHFFDTVFTYFVLWHCDSLSLMSGLTHVVFFRFLRSSKMVAAPRLIDYCRASSDDLHGLLRQRQPCLRIQLTSLNTGQVTHCSGQINHQWGSYTRRTNKSSDLLAWWTLGKATWHARSRKSETSLRAGLQQVYYSRFPVVLDQLA